MRAKPDVRSDTARLAVRIREAVDRGADAAESIHRRVAKLPLAPFEGVEPLEGMLKDLRRVQDRSIGALYDLVRDVNHEVVRLAEDLLRPAKARPKPRARGKVVRHAPAEKAA